MLFLWILRLLQCSNEVASAKIYTFSNTLTYYNGILNDHSSFYDRSEFYGFWHIDEKYGSQTRNDLKEYCPSGCHCHLEILDCSGLSSSVSEVSLRRQSFHRIENTSFPAATYSSVQELSIISCSNFYKIESFIIDKFPNIKKLIITDTLLADLPAFQTTFGSLKNIDLYKNKLSSIRDEYLSYVPNLQYLNMAGNEINYLADSALSGTSLKFVTFANNKLPFVPDAFRTISDTVEYIGLEINQITVTRAEALSDLAVLKHLNISNNPISFIEYGAFYNCPSLNFIEMHFSDLSILEEFSFHKIPSLRYISLYRTPALTDISGNAFSNLISLSILLFQYSSLKMLDFRMFNNTPTLEYLILDSNKLTAVPHLMLLEARLSKLRWLTLIDNDISDITDIADEQLLPVSRILKAQYNSQFAWNSSVATLSELILLDLSGNHLAGLPDYFFTALPNLQYLHLDNNIISDDLIGTNALTESCRSLQTVRLNNNNLKTVPSILFSPPNINLISLNQNLLTFLKGGTFSSLTNLNYLYLASNNILTIEDQTFPSSLRGLDLRHNDFDFLDENQLNNLPLLSSLDLGYNRITYLPDDVFANNSQLNDIKLENNKLGWINKAVFRDSPLSGKIYLSNNEIKTIEHGTFYNKNFIVFSALNNQLSHLPDDCMFCNLTRSRVQIHLQNNRLEYLHSFMFSNISSAHSIGLSNNLITDIMNNAFYNIGLWNTLDLSNNPVNNINSFSFNKFTSLHYQSTIDLTDILPYNVVKPFTFNDVTVQNVNLASNNISRIEREALNNVNMNTLTLSDVHLNFMAKHVVVGYIKNIYMGTNNLARLVQGAFEKTKCDSIDLSNNKISFVDRKSLPDCTNTINLDNNLIPRWIKDIIVSGDRLRILTVKNNKIHEIEPDALTVLMTSLQTLDFSGNKLPSLSADAISGFASLEILYLSGNRIRIIEEQTGVVGLKSIVLDSNNNKLRYFSKSLFDSIAAANKTAVFIPNTVDNPIPCSCSNFKAFTQLSEVNRLYFNNLQYCEFEGTTFSLVKDSSEYFVTSKRQLLCEPQVTEFDRVTTNWVDDLPDEEQLKLTWKLWDVALWNKQRVFCCTEDTSTKCLTVTQFRVKCYRDEDDVVVTDTSLPITSLQACDYEFSTTVTAAYTSSSIACTVDVTADEKTSPPSPYAVSHPENKASVALTCQRRDFPLSATYFDFDNNLYDFQNFGDDNIISDVTYKNHMLGPFLFKTATNDSVSRWFTVNSDTLGVLQEDVCLDRIKKNQFKWFARNWYPLDAIVSADNFDRDEDFIAHNLYFTARISFPLLRSSKNQEIWVGGPDDVWVYVGGAQVLELLAETDDSAPLPCASVVISTSGVTVNLGTLNFAQGASATKRCIATGVTKDFPDVTFTSGTVYLVDMFFTQRRSLSSSLYLELKNIVAKDSPGPRFFYDMSENKPPKGLIAELELQNDQGITGPYTTKIKLGKEYVVVQPNSYSYISDVVEKAPNVHPGGDIPDYFNCSDEETSYDPINQRVNTVLDEGSNTFYLILVKKLDFDVLEADSQTILFSFTISFTSFDLDYAFQTAFLLTLLDANDNCPVFTEYSASPMPYESLYALSIEGKNIPVTDADSFLNQVIEFYVGEIKRPDNETFYTSLSDYYLYEKDFVDYTVTIHAVDSGSKRYGSSAEVFVTLSTGCIRDLEFVINKTEGVFHVQAPGWMVSGYNGSYCESCTIGYRCPGNGVRIKCTTCHQEYENADYTWPGGYPRLEERCDNPSSAEFSFGGSFQCQDCKAGWICKSGVATPVLESMKYVEACTNSSCNDTIQDCKPGYSCIAGVAATCKVGTYNDGTFTTCQLCPPGKFANTAGSVACSCCPPGMVSSHGKDQCKYCSENEVSAECDVCRRCDGSAGCPCLGSQHGCFEGQQCVNLPGNTNLCLDCPEGSEPLDNTCADVDECLRYDPCFGGVTCTNLSPGFKCDPCPSGYSGSSPQGIGQTDTQECEDVNECEVNNGGCDPNSECINLPGSVRCGLCAPGLIGSGETACTNGNLCSLGTHRCDTSAICIYTGPGSYVCQCGPQYAGDGYNCALDTDLDGYPDTNLNCNDSVCVQDNCPEMPNPGQADNDGDNVGDVCDGDIDGDTLVNQYDTCPYQLYTPGQGDGDGDGDGVPDQCDNCKEVYNPYQQDSDEDGTGDHCQCLEAACYTDTVCEGTSDGDGDGIPDTCDNCPFVPNSLQSDTDKDGAGDVCDDDIDDDTVPNSDDNCPYVSNTDQTDTDGDLAGDMCDDSTSWPLLINDRDSDGEGVIDLIDNCPNNADLTKTDFVHHSTVNLSPGQESGAWMVSESGRSVQLVSEKAGPAVLLAKYRFGDVDFNGTFYVRSSSTESGYIGLVLGYQSTGRFYLLVWRQDYETWLHGNCGDWCSNSHAKGGTTGLQIRRVHNSITDKATIESSLWLSSDSEVSTLIWQDSNHVSWTPGTAYRWFVSHRPSTGSIHIRIYTARDGLIVDSGKVFDMTYLGGKLGVYNFHQSQTIWSNMKVACVQPERYGIELSNTYLTLGSLAQLQITKNFVMSAWVKAKGGGAVQPVLCAPSSRLCLYIDKEMKVVGTFGDKTISHESVLETGIWYLVAMKVDLQNKILTVYRYRDEVTVALEESDLTINTTLYLGTNLTANFTGEVTDVRVISRLLTNDTLSILTTPSLSRQRSMGIVALHLTFMDRNIQDTESTIQITPSTPAPSVISVSIAGYLHRVIQDNSQQNRKKRSARDLVSELRAKRKALVTESQELRIERRKHRLAKKFRVKEEL